ncbi:hypothetical protein [Flavobacterium sp. CF136]|uniref:hypothetical protein n=1 Tax=Flavobacterium sp. (strain CF136) TaxID=1144313 RepID=UPI000271B07C|nr:hypothetical protein [Flavobacterium sp. CF136]EJL62502.1 hypothetical protein PMI10_02881 [Flavobacterium sp. CF136]
MDLLELESFIQSTSQQAKNELSNLLISKFYNSKFILLRKQDKRQSENIIHYFLKNGTGLKNDWIKKSIPVITKQSKSFSESELLEKLDELFWVTILKYSTYKGDEIMFLELLEKAFMDYLKTNTNNGQHQLINGIISFDKIAQNTIITPSFIETETLR